MRSTPHIIDLTLSDASPSPPNPAAQDGSARKSGNPSASPTGESRSPVDKDVYAELPIASLAPGPQRVYFTGLVVNILGYEIDSQSPKAAKGCLRLLLTDGTADILAKCYYAEACPNASLGDVISVWTTHVHHSTSKGASPTTKVPPASIMANIFPERDAGCKVRLRREEDRATKACRSGLSANNSDLIRQVITLEGLFGDTEDSMPGVTLLVCVVAIVTRKYGSAYEMLSLGVRDRHSQSIFTLQISASLFVSAARFEANKTVLLIRNPHKHPAKTKTLTLGARSQIYLDPDIPETSEVRKQIQRENCPINESFPRHLFDFDKISSNLTRVKYTLAEFAELTRICPDKVYTGYVSVLLATMNVIGLLEKGQLFSRQCCCMPIYSNELHAICGQCDEKLHLLLNPNMVEEISDETASICIRADTVEGPSSLSPSKSRSNHRPHNRLLISSEAFAGLLGRTPEDLAAMVSPSLPPELFQSNFQTIGYLEDRLSWMRVTLLVGWTGAWGGGRLAILRVLP